MPSDDENLPPITYIKARRFLVAVDLGPVRKGDHVLTVGEVVVALDTSRRPEDLWPDRPISLNPETHPRPPAAKKISGPHKKKTIKRKVTSDEVLNLIRAHQPINSKTISDQLEIERGDIGSRSQVTRYLFLLKQAGTIKPNPSDPKTETPRYILDKAVN